MNIKDAPPALRNILQALGDGKGLVVSQHEHDPQPNEWYVGTQFDGFGGAGDLGPFETAEEALIKGIKWLYGLYEAALDNE